jgi:hypothetical protein
MYVFDEILYNIFYMYIILFMLLRNKKNGSSDAPLVFSCIAYVHMYTCERKEVTVSLSANLYFHVLHGHACVNWLCVADEAHLMA